jgi:putative transposase
MGFLKGKSAIRLHRAWMKRRSSAGQHFWARGYWVSTVRLDEDKVRQYIRHQEKEEMRQESLFNDDDV